MLIEQELMNALTEKIQSNKNLLELRELLVLFRDKGMTKESMRDALNSLISDENEDTIWDLLDFVEGFCNPDLDLY
ncbi:MULTISPECIES: hypothetical protein [Photorhabdus]|uniref:Uncharacterized protein n=2 Tax=Photorhabdus asymbiotica TaxID=291112 RepID=B6VN24_PHOAA|nr:hypothetical protein [Photorhabdus asymbiotica]RKS54129.1 hypothetical protein BDD30_4494 [Photorhabdus asymbiotica]CAQ85104.1 conserved hypothetical protein [Photorhabdus asymbiotica]CAR67554.1 Hypothetical Protein PA-RVA15-17-0985 [Photorhabdus asymbiotica subsp. asymbiotica ATCC 43949]